MSNIQAFTMHEAGAIGGVPGPNNGLWPGGVTVYVNTDTMEVDHTSLIGGSGDEQGVEGKQETEPQKDEAPMQESSSEHPDTSQEQNTPAMPSSLDQLSTEESHMSADQWISTPTTDVPQEEFPQVTPVASLEG